MTLLVALGPPTAVKCGPVRASWSTCGKKPLTVLIGMTTSRASRDSEALAGPAPGDMACPQAAIERIAAIPTNGNARSVSVDPVCMSLMPPFTSVSLPMILPLLTAHEYINSIRIRLQSFANVVARDLIPYPFDFNSRHIWTQLAQKLLTVLHLNC